MQTEIIPRLRRAQENGKLVCSADIGQTGSGKALMGCRVHWVENFRNYSVCIGTKDFAKLVVLPQKSDEDILKVLNIDTGELVDSDESEDEESED